MSADTTTDVAPGPGDDAPPGVLTRVPLHPVLLAAWPALSLWSSNATEVRPEEAWPLVWVPVLAAVGLAVVLRPLLAGWRRSSVVASVVAVVLLMGGRVLDPATTPYTAVLVVLLALVGTGLLVRRLADGTVGGVTSALNVLGGVLVLLTLPAVLPTLTGDDGGAAEAITANGGTAADVWYVIPDRYPRADVLADVFDFDNTPFLEALEERGFDVGDAALANYPKTAHSLAATWNLDYVDNLVDVGAQAGDDWGPLYGLLRDHVLGRTLQGAGYEYTHLGTWWSPTAVVETADRNVRLDARSEFGGVWLTSTLLSPLIDLDDPAGATGTEIREGFRDLNYDYTVYQLDALDRLASQGSGPPRFVVAHVTQPHEPYVFDRDGTRVTAEDASSRTREDNLVRQVENLNRRLLDMVDTILERDPGAVIVLQSDEGPHPRARTGPAYDWTTADDATLEEKLGILSAIRLPEGPDLPDDRTSVNTWRWILNTVIGTDLPVLDDRVMIFPGEDHLYTLVEVTDRLTE